MTVMRMPAAEAGAPPLLAAAGIEAGYDALAILRGIDFHVHAGETVGLLGRNGMGKTTLLRTLTGLLTPQAGRIAFDGADITRSRTSARVRAGIALVPEGRGIFPNLTVYENLTFAARATGKGGGWSEERIYALFPRLAERRHHWGNQLSGGEQQMLSIGRALMTNPRLLMLDEATEGLAPLLRDEIWATLRVVAKTGMSIVVVDKNIEDLFALAGRSVVLVKGEVVYDGTSAALQRDEEAVHRWLGV